MSIIPSKYVGEPISTVIISKTTKKFVAKEKFVENSKEVKFYRIWENFHAFFLNGEGKIEEPMSKQELRYGTLLRYSVSSPTIREELGSEEKAQTTLSGIYDLLLRQSKGEKKGVLLTNGCANIFHVQDASDVLRSVWMRWTDRGWFVLSDSIEVTSGWEPGDRVFLANS